MYIREDKDKLSIITDYTLSTNMDRHKDNPIVASLRKKDDPDLLWFNTRYITADLRNDNGDGFKKGELEKGADSVVLKPTNWIHNDEVVVGFIAGYEFVEENDNTYMDVYGPVWRGTKSGKKYAAQLEKDSSNGLMAASMEAVSDTVQCSVCEQDFPRIIATDNGGLYDHYCDHLKGRETNGATRWINNPRFIGMGFVPTTVTKQADPNAFVIEVAKQINKGGVYMFSQEQVNSLVEAEVAKVEARLQEANTKVEELTKATEELKASIAEKDVTLEASTQEITDLKTSVETMTTELQEMKDSQLLATRAGELKASGVEVTDEIKARLVAMSEEDYTLIKKVASKTSAPQTPVVAFVTDTGDQSSDMDIIKNAFARKVGE